MEWLARELSLVDLAIAIDGLPTEVARWIANLDHPELQRVFLTYRPDELTPERAEEIELERYDGVFASGSPVADIEWTPIGRAIAPQDLESVAPEYLPRSYRDEFVTPDEVARVIESAVLVREAR